jgi:sodium transport system permease protein
MGVGFHIFKKELMDTLRDRRTLLTMIVIPVLIFPLILTVFVNVSESFQKDAMDKDFKVGYLQQDAQNVLLSSLALLPDSLTRLELVAFDSEEALKNRIQEDSIQAGLIFSADFSAALQDQRTGKVTVWVNETKIGNRDRVKGYLEGVGEYLKINRLAELNLLPEQITPLQVTYENTASDKETLGKLAGGILPYLFIAFGFLGCMYPAIDLFTGEKERGTIETLLTTPVPRWKILIGKMGVVVLSGLLAASLALFGLFLSIEVLDLIQDPVLLEIMHSILTPTFVLMLYLLLIPLTIFFAGLMIPIAVYAKTFKEAQSIITPLNIVVILPAMVGFFPGIELNSVTAAIPIVNVVLATKELIAGTLEFSLLFISFAVMLGLAAIAVFISFKQFDKETNVVL